MTGNSVQSSECVKRRACKADRLHTSIGILVYSDLTSMVAKIVPVVSGVGIAKNFL